jgi:hypothetical protein
LKQQGDRKIAHAQAGLQLHVMGGQQYRDRFDFQKFSQDISPETSCGGSPLCIGGIPTSHRPRIPARPNSRHSDGGVEGFQQSRTTMPIHLDRPPDDAFGQLLMV